MHNVSGLYMITCQPPGRLPLYYVGQSKDVTKRCGQHRTALRCGRHYNTKMQNYWNAYGEESFSFELIHECPVDRLDDAELWWLEHMAGHPRTFNFGTRPVASMRGLKFSDDHRRKIAAAHSGERHYRFGQRLSDEHRARISAGGRGIKRSESTRAKISAANLGERNSMFGKHGCKHLRSKPVEGIHLETGAVVRFESASLAQKAGFDQAAISRCCNGKKEFHKGYRWRFADITQAYV